MQNIAIIVGKDLIYVFLALALVPAFGFFVMDKILTRNYSLKQALFDDDNPVAGFEFGGMLLSMLYLGYVAISGSSAGSFWLDLGVAGAYIVGYILLFALTRTALAAFLRVTNSGFDLNDEIFRQQNWAAACCSLSLMIIVTNSVTEVDIHNGGLLKNLVFAFTVFAFGAGSIFCFKALHLNRKSITQAMFVDDNPAAGVSLIGFVFAVNMITANVVKWVRGVEASVFLTFVYVVGISFLSILLLIASRLILERFIRHHYVVWIHWEIVEQKNVGASFIDIFLTIGIALVLVGGLL